MQIKLCFTSLVKGEWSPKLLVCQFVTDILDIFHKPFYDGIRYTKINVHSMNTPTVFTCIKYV